MLNPKRLKDPLSHVEPLLALWNEASTPPLLIDSRLLHQYLDQPYAAVYTIGLPWKGILFARPNPELGTLDAILVHPQHRTQGLGRQLLNHAVSELWPNTSWRFGGGSHHFVPGLPQELASSHTFLIKLGLTPDWLAHDLLWTLPNTHPLLWDRSVYRLITSQEEHELSTLTTHFGLRWQTDTAKRMIGLKSGKKEEIMGAYHGETLVGFCHAWTPDSTHLGPSTFWLDRSDKAWAGIGPIGIHPRYRGLGLGSGIVKATLSYLQQQGATRIGVDWTGLPTFYEGCGFKRWLSYRGYHTAWQEATSKTTKFVD